MFTMENCCWTKIARDDPKIKMYRSAIDCKVGDVAYYKSVDYLDVHERDNRYIVDNNTSQKLTYDDIIAIKQGNIFNVLIVSFVIMLFQNKIPKNLLLDSWRIQKRSVKKHQCLKINTYYVRRHVI